MALPNRQLIFRVTVLFFDESLRRFSVTERRVIYYKPLLTFSNYCGICVDGTDRIYKEAIHLLQLAEWWA